MPGYWIDLEKKIKMGKKWHKFHENYPGRFFRLCCYNKGQLLNSAELQKQIQGILDDLSPVDEGKVQLFWEGHKNLRYPPYGFDIYLVNVKTIRRMSQIFVAFSEKLSSNWVVLLMPINFFSGDFLSQLVLNCLFGTSWEVRTPTEKNRHKRYSSLTITKH